MYSVKHKIFLLSFILIAFQSRFGFTQDLDATTYTITNIEYNIDGLVRIAAIQDKVDLQPDISFSSLEALNRYILNKRTLLTSHRVLSNTLSTITHTYYWNKEKQRYDVTLYVYVTVGSTLLVLPYIKYSTDNGTSITLRIRDYNFIGSLDTLSVNVDWNIKENKNGEIENRFVSSVGLSYPWAFGKHNLSLSLDESVEHKFKNAEFQNVISASLNYSYPLAQRISYGASIKAKERSFFDDTIRNYHYAEITVKPISIGIRLNKVPIPTIGNIGYNIYGKYEQVLPIYSQFYVRNPENDTIPSTKESEWFSTADGTSALSNDPNSTRLNGYPGVGQSISFGSISNIKGGYFKKGISFSLDNSYSYNVRDGFLSDRYNYTKLDITEGWSVDVSTQIRWHEVLWNTVGISVRGYGVQNLYFKSKYEDLTGNGSSFDGRMRGILSGGFSRAWRGAVFNSDIMIRLGQIRLTKLFSAEMHAGPLLDFAIRQQAASDFNIDEDTKITTGLEVIAHHIYLGGIRIRGSYGFDLLKTIADNQSGETSLIKGIWNNKEISIGTELFY